MSVLGRNRILAALRERDSQKRLFVSPILSRKQIGDASIDVRLGYDFVTVKRGNVGSLDPAKRLEDPEKFRTRHRLNHREPFFLHPNEMALASTLEFVRVPVSLAAYVTSRSKWGRTGLIIATATAIHPGFTSTITLELINSGNVPLVLYPGLMVAQIILYDADGATPYVGDLAGRVTPFAPNQGSSWQSDINFWLPPETDRRRFPRNS